MPADLLIRLGNLIRRLRRKHGWTQAEFAERVEIHRSFLADVETRKAERFDSQSGVDGERIESLAVATVLAALRMGERRDVETYSL